MTLLDAFVAATLAQVTLITLAALIVIWFARRHSAFRHAAGVVGLVLVVGSPLMVLVLPRPAWLPVEKPAQESTALATVQSANPQFTGVQANPEIAEQPGVTLDRLPGGALVTAAPRVPELVPELVEHLDAFPPVAEAPLLVEPAPSPAPPSTGVPPGPKAAAPAQPAEAAVVRSRAWGLSTLFNVLSVVWCLGILVTAFRDWLRRRELRIVARTTSGGSLERVTSAAQDVRSTLGLREDPRIHVSGLAPLPFVIGVWKPIVVLPSDIVAAASNERLRDVLIHECAHIIRRDSWVHLLQRISAIVFWFHPGVVWLNAQIGRAREELCDNFVLLAGDAAEYAETLLDLSESCGGKRLGLSALGLSAMGLFSTRWTLEQRIGGLLDPARDKLTRTGRATWLILLALFGSFSLLIGGVRLAATTAPTNSDPREASAAPTQKVTLRGRFVDETGKPLANVQVQILLQPTSSSFWLTYSRDTARVIAQAKSDDEGRFVIADARFPISAPDAEETLQPVITVKREGGMAVIPEILDFKIEGATLPADPVTMEFKEPMILSNQLQTLSGIVTDVEGQPVVGAKVSLLPADGQHPIPGIWTALTDREGRYSIKDLGAWKRAPSTVFRQSNGLFGSMTEPSRKIVVEHPDHAITVSETTEIPNQVNISLPLAVVIKGSVVDAATGQPAPAVKIRAMGIGLDGCYQARTDQNGNYRLPVQRDYYRVWVLDNNRVADVLRQFDATTEPPASRADFRLTAGALVVGSVIDESTNQPFPASDVGPTFVAHYGPAYVKSTAGIRMQSDLQGGYGAHHSVVVNPDGSFQLRVAPGENTIFVARYDGEMKQATRTIVVKAGEEQRIDFRVKFAKSEPSERDANGFVTGEPQPADTDGEPEAIGDSEPEHVDPVLLAAGLLRYNTRLEQAAAAANGGRVPEFVNYRIPSRKRRDSVVNRLLDTYERNTLGFDDRDRPVRTIKEIVDLGAAALPDLLEELDATQDPWMVRMLGFTLRAINDRRAVPALIRAIPKSVSIPVPPRTRRYDELTNRYEPIECFDHCRDRKLQEFCKLNDAKDILPSEDRFYWQSPTGEICGALRRLTGARNGEDELLDHHEVRAVSAEQMQVRAQRVAANWESWWQQHAHDNFEKPQIPPNEAELIAELESLGATLNRDGSLPGRPIGCIRFEDARGFSERALELVKQFPHLGELHLRGSWPATREFNSFDSLVELTNLRHLWLSGVVITDRELASIGRLRQLRKLMLNGKIQSDGSGLKALGALSQLKVLDLGMSQITDARLAEVVQLEGLTYLRLYFSDVGDSGMRHVGKLKNLTSLDLSGTKITNEGLRELKDLKQLVWLDLSKTKITGDGLPELGHLTSLERLDLSETPNTGRGIEALAGLKNLTSLTMNSTPTNDAGLKSISRLQSLHRLELSDTKITDAGLAELKEMKNLDSLEVKETDVTTAGVQELTTALPELSLHN